MNLRVLLLASVLAVAMHHRAALGAEPVDLNTAPESVLQSLPGIGPKKAAAIVALRTKRPLSRVSQLLEVRGIGKKTLERLKPLVRVGSVTAAAPAMGSSPSGGGDQTSGPGRTLGVTPRPASSAGGASGVPTGQGAVSAAP